MADEINISDRNLFTSIINSNMTEGDRWLLYLSLFEYANNSFASVITAYKILSPQANPFNLDQRVITILNDIMLSNKPKTA